MNFFKTSIFEHFLRRPEVTPSLTKYLNHVHIDRFVITQSLIVHIKPLPFRGYCSDNFFGSGSETDEWK